jgi:Tfp pilus assembly protein PilW
VKISALKRDLGMTLVEIMVSAGCGSLLLAAVVTAGVSLQRSFGSVESYSVAEGDQLRVLDYIALDCRRATKGTVGALTTPTIGNGSWTGGTWVTQPYYRTGGTWTVDNTKPSTLLLTLPVFYTSATGSIVTPTLSAGTLSYGSGSVTVCYYQDSTDSTFKREVVLQDSSGTVTSDTITTVARNVASFTVTNQNLTSTISSTIMFFPTFKYTTGTGTWRSGATTPLDAVGVDGDMYVIDPTSATASTIGNVYRRSGGTYSLLQNVKATTVYCNTFLRNASARQ